MRLHTLALLITYLGMSATAMAQSSYDTGYNAGYYGTNSPPQSQTSNYGRGYGDGAYDSDQEDRLAKQRSEDFESTLRQEQERDSRAISGQDDNEHR